MTDNLLRFSVPARTTSFVGRARQLEELRSLLQRFRLVTITGPGGVGKTSLAAELCRRLDIAHDFPHGLSWVDLAPVARGDRVVQVVAATLRVREATDQAPIETIGDWIAGRQMLLVLDNCEHVTESCRDLVVALLARAPDLRIVTTSRSVIDAPGEALWPTEPLPLPALTAGPTRVSDLAQTESVQLFVERAATLVPEFELTDENSAHIEAVCRRLDGIPLAIELAAARVRMLSVSQIAERLDDSLGLLTSRRSHSVPHHQTMRASVEWSWEDLGDKQRALLRRLAVFPSTFSLSAAEETTPDDDALGTAGFRQVDVLDLLSDLVDRSLVQVRSRDVDEPRCGVLEVVRQYALEHLKSQGEESAVRNRHLAHYLAVAERASPELIGPNQALWLERIDIELPNIRAALDWAAAHPGNGPQGVRLATLLRWYWDRRGLYREGRGVLDAALASAPEAGAAMRAEALNAAGTLTWRQADYPSTQSYYEAALAARREVGDEHGVGLMLGNLGMLAHSHGQSGAEPLLQESLEICTAYGDLRGTANALLNLGNVYLDRLDFDSAEEAFTAAHGTFGELGDSTMVTACWENVGIVAENRRDHVRAAHIFEEVLQSRRELGNPSGIANALHNLGMEKVRLGYLDEAGALFEESLDIFADLGDSYGVALNLEGVAHLCLARGRAGAAARNLGAACSVRERIQYVQPGDQAANYNAALSTALQDLGNVPFERAFAAGHAALLSATIARAQSDCRMRVADDRSDVSLLDTLTPREREVVALIAQGMTNSEIGAALCVVPKTVEKHVTSVLSKLGFAHRSQVAVWAATQGTPADPDPATR